MQQIWLLGNVHVASRPVLAEFGFHPIAALVRVKNPRLFLFNWRTVFQPGHSLRCIHCTMIVARIVNCIMVVSVSQAPVSPVTSPL